MKNAIKLTIGISEKGDVLTLKLSDNIACMGSPTHLFYKCIEQYINMYNAYNRIEKEDSKTSYEIYVSYYSLSYLQSNKHGYYGIGLDYSTSFGEYNPAASGEIVIDRPIIHLTYDDIFLDNAEPYKRYARYMDSSIWNYYVPIQIKCETAVIQGEDGKMQPKYERYDFTPFERALKEIIHNSFNRRYNLRVAREYAHLFSRIVNQSFLPDISGHGKNVSPYLFHSERKSFEDLKKKEHRDILSEIKQYKWRFLLVDDHSTKNMAVVDGSDTLTKLDIVKTELEKLFKNIEKDNEPVIISSEKDTEDIKKNATIYIECATSIEDAKNKLKEKKYEVILLDYLLGEKSDGREYGYELLKGIWYNNLEEERKNELEKSYEEYVFDYKKGPDNRFFFMFISAFATAVSERLLTEGWLRSEDYWYIGEGACPVNTPYLFQYRLLRIMEKRMKDMGLSKILGINSNDFEKSYIKEKIIDVIYDDRTNIRQNANNRFNDVLSVLYNYKNLLVDTHNASNPFDSPESTLATALVMNNVYIGGFLEHLTQLVYLTAFGTVRQWPEMWEEYQFLKSVVGRIKDIEKYIFDLKNNNI